MKSKLERQLWWQNLSPEEKETWIAIWQERKEQKRKNRPPKVQKFIKSKPWVTDGVNDENREQWRRTILAKNPWMDSSVFN